MKAVVLEKFGGIENFQMKDVEKPAISNEQALVKVRASGVCYHDLINRQGHFPRTKVPAIMGHEVAGDVIEIGSRVKSLKVGDRVAITQAEPCGVCEKCRKGREAICSNSKFFGEEISGGYAEYIVASEKSLAVLPDNISYEEGSILACTIGTALHAIKSRARLMMGETILITGASGGVGIHAVQLAKITGAKIIAVSSSANKVRFLKDHGADEVIVSPDLKFNQQVKELTKGRGVDVVLEIVGNLSFESSLRSLTSGGRLVFVGNVNATPVQIPPAMAILKELEFYGTAKCSLQELYEVIDLVERGLIKPIVGKILPLDAAAEAHQLMEDKQVQGRVVLVP